MRRVASLIAVSPQRRRGSHAMTPFALDGAVAPHAYNRVRTLPSPNIVIDVYKNKVSTTQMYVHIFIYVHIFSAGEFAQHMFQVRREIDQQFSIWVLHNWHQKVHLLVV